mgnify:CR=1 FL=1
MKTALAALALTLSAGAASAGELLVHTFSIHGKSTYEHTTHYSGVDGADGHVVVQWDVTETRRFNNTNLGLGWRFDNGAIVGTYENSYRHRSFYVGGVWMWPTSIPRLEVGLTALAITGYREVTDKPVTVAGALGASYRVLDRTKAYVFFTPKVGRGEAVAHLAFGQEF